MKTHFLFVAAGAMLLISACLFTNCTNTGPEPDPVFVGKWAGYISGPPDSVFLVLTIGRGGEYHAQTTEAGAAGLDVKGTWTRKGNHLLIKEEFCTVGNPPVPLACLESDSLLINITGDKWTIRDTEAGQLQTVTLERID